MDIHTNTTDVGQVILEQYHAGKTTGTFQVSLEDPPVDIDPKEEVRGVIVTYED